ncbi:MAG TPA: DUF4192 family protein [Glaciibacter sp.]|nr:DUF4192 family protein [Glaciibacter sp.]
MQPTIVKTSQPGEFLALVPELVGFQPENSVAMVAFRGNRTCGALRFTLPEPDGSEKVYKRIATTIVGMVCKIPGVDAVVPVVYTEEGFADEDVIPRNLFAQTLIQRCELSGFLVRDAFCVASDGWGSYDTLDTSTGGRPLSDLALPAGRQGGLDPERTPLGSLTSWADLPEVGLAARERLARVFRRYQRLAAKADSVPDLFDIVGNLLDPVATAELVPGWNPEALDIPDAAVLLLLVQSAANRDQMMLQFAFGRKVGAEAFELNARYAALQRATGLSMDEIVLREMEHRESSVADADESESATGTATDVQSEADQRISDLMMGMTSTRPDPDRIEAAIRVLKAVVSLAPRSTRPAPFCMLAWLSWALGRGSVAGIFIDRALEIDAHYGMARLLDTLLGTGHLPEWAYAVPPDPATYERTTERTERPERPE